MFFKLFSFSFFFTQLLSIKWNLLKKELIFFINLILFSSVFHKLQFYGIILFFRLLVDKFHDLVDLSIYS